MIWAADLAFSQRGGKSKVSFAAPPRHQANYGK